MTLSSPAGGAPGYQLPPDDVVRILDRQQTPAITLSPTREYLLRISYEAYPPLALLARPFLKLGGIRVDPHLAARQRTTQYTGIHVQHVPTGRIIGLAGLPPHVRIGFPAWSLDGKKFAFTQDTDEGMRVWVAETEAALCRPLPGLRVTDVLTGPLLWADDGKTLFALSVPDSRGDAPDAPLVPDSPLISQTSGKTTQAATYQDLLQSPRDETSFEHFGTTQLVRVDTDQMEVTALGKPGLIASLRLSPDEKYLLVTRIKRPFSWRVPFNYFSRQVEVWDAETGAHVYTVSDLPVSDEIPRQGVPVGPRGVQWQELKPHTLLWTEALDGGDPLAKVPHRDRVLRLATPFEGEPEEVLRVTHRFSGWDWLPTEDEVWMTEYDRDRRWRTTYRLSLSQPDTRETLFDLSVNDAYNDPGSPVYRVGPNGERTILQDGSSVYLAGRGASEGGDRPFLNRMNLSTRETERLFTSPDSGFETFVAFVDTSDGGRRDRAIVSRQSRTEPVNYFLQDGWGEGFERVALTDFEDPHPQLTGMSKEIVRYTREMDGAPLSGTLYLPPGYQPERDGPLPLVLWAYPQEYSDTSTAGQVRGSADTFTYLAGTSPLWFVTQGYAVLNDATMPVVGDPETMNDTFVEQIVGAAKAAIDEMVRRGVADPNRVLVAGHSYGAFMTASLLAHAPGMFAAGIARSGAYNRTLTPFGFQSERRSYWEATDIYTRLSPFTYANKIADPILLIHGQADNNSGTYPIQSERMFQALQAHGATAKLVLLPHESHGYRARESVLHVLSEMFAWADKYVKNKQQS